MSRVKKRTVPLSPFANALRRVSLLVFVEALVETGEVAVQERAQEKGELGVGSCVYDRVSRHVQGHGVGGEDPQSDAGAPAQLRQELDYLGEVAEEEGPADREEHVEGAGPGPPHAEKQGHVEEQSEGEGQDHGDRAHDGGRAPAPPLQEGAVQGHRNVPYFHFRDH